MPSASNNEFILSDDPINLELGTKEFWTTSESEFEDHSMDMDQDWDARIVSEEIRQGKSRYEIAWDNWHRADGTNTTWDHKETSDEPALLATWAEKTNRYRERLVKDSLDIEIWSNLDLLETDTRLHAQALEKKLETRRRNPLDLRRRMHALERKHGIVDGRLQVDRDDAAAGSSRQGNQRNITSRELHIFPQTVSLSALRTSVNTSSALQRRHFLASFLPGCHQPSWPKEAVTQGYCRESLTVKPRRRYPYAHYFTLLRHMVISSYGLLLAIINWISSANLRYALKDGKFAMLSLVRVIGVTPKHRGRLCSQLSTMMWFNTSTVLPLGNGRLGAEMLGLVPAEVIVLNEDHIWSGSMNDPNNKNCSNWLPQIREYIWQDKLDLAQNLTQDSCMGIPLKQQMYQTAGNLTLTFPDASLSDVKNYNHSLDLTTAIATTTYVIDAVQFTRSAFASHPDNVIVIKISTNETGKVEFKAGLLTPMVGPNFVVTNNSLSMTAKGTTKYDVPGSIKFLTRIEVATAGANASVEPNEDDATLSVSGADEAQLVIAIDTNFVRYDDVSADPEARVSETLDSVRGKTWDELLDTHLADYQALFGRVDISLGTPSEYTYLPTHIRKNLSGGADADQDVFALYAQYGRYLGIASSRKTEPANLQGIWNHDTNPAWGSKYTININQQMNSWLAEPLNTAETLDPLWNLLTELAERGKAIAAEEYKITRGWVAHHNTGLWRDSAPIDSAYYGMWHMGVAWLMQNVWEHYAFDPSQEEWVRDVAYPLMKGLSEFYLEFLVPTPKEVEDTEYLVMVPSMSPEHGLGTYSGTKISLTYGTNIDNSLLRDLFNHTAGFASLLGVDEEFAANLTKTTSRLMPIRIGSLGQIQEWAKDYDSNGGTNHLSQLYPLFPGAQIDSRFNTTLVNAAKVSLKQRGDSSAGWPTAWRANCFARLLDGEKAYYYMQRLLHLFSYDNLWSINDVFQIDANFGESWFF
uniref:Uncharacterized protein n=1 Tax=Moniliophthora roreri TaxID=221103 RepID=A0A0W0FDY4_MONRR